MRLAFVLSLFVLAALDAVATPLGLQLPSEIVGAAGSSPTPTSSTPPPPTATPDPDNADINACAQYCGFTAVAPDLYFCGVTEAPLNCVCRNERLRVGFQNCVAVQCPEFETRINARQTQQCALVSQAIAKKNQTGQAAAQTEDDIDAFSSATHSEAPLTVAILGLTALVTFSL
ncbi:hypothetical protein AURDEDRAFT_174163 [Auricularia subglabra TFB-10046 SS5]|nr:hypothetical protein AURDEDRAFT_174163 [Auricularia subglabra TFB-10046 SS5]